MDIGLINFQKYGSNFVVVFFLKKRCYYEITKKYILVISRGGYEILCSKLNDCIFSNILYVFLTYIYVLYTSPEKIHMAEMLFLFHEKFPLLSVINEERLIRFHSFLITQFYAIFIFEPHQKRFECKKIESCFCHFFQQKKLYCF